MEYIAGPTNTRSDAYNIKERTFNNSLYNLQEELRYAVKNKKENALSLAMKVFSKIQDIKMSQTTTLDSGITDEYQNKIDEYELFRNNESLSKTLKAELFKLRSSLDDKSSPSLSQIKQYHKDGILGLNDDQVHKVVGLDLSDFSKASERLGSIYDELENKERTMIALNDAYNQGIKYYKSKRDTMVNHFQEKEEKVQNMIEKEIFDAYVEYQRDLLLQNDNRNPNLDRTKITDKHKVKVIKQIFGVMEGKLLQNFGTDLLLFGISHDVPDAVRIGENLAALNNEEIPDHVRESLQNYIIKNSK